METIDTQNHYELGDIQNRLKEKAKEYGFDEYTWIEIFERVAFYSLEGLR